MNQVLLGADGDKRVQQALTADNLVCTGRLVAEAFDDANDDFFTYRVFFEIGVV